MYYAVWRFGPRWEVSAIVDCLPNPVMGKFCASSQSRGVEIKTDSVDLTKLPLSQIKSELAAVASELEKSQLSPEALESWAE